MDSKTHLQLSNSITKEKKDAKTSNSPTKTYEEFLAEINLSPNSLSSNRTSLDIRSGDEFLLSNDNSNTLTTTDEEFAIMENALTNLLSSKQQIDFLKKERNSLIAVYQNKINEQNEQIKYLQLENEKLKNSINSIKQKKNSTSSSTASSTNSCNSSSNSCCNESKNQAKISTRNNDLFAISSSSPNSSSSSNNSLQRLKEKNEFSSRLLPSSSSSASSSSSSTETAADESKCFEHYLDEIMRQLEKALSLQTNIHKEYFKLQEEFREQKQQAKSTEQDLNENTTKSKSNNSNSILNIINEIKDINRQINTTTLGTTIKRTTNANHINIKTNANNTNNTSNNSFFTTSNSWIFNNMMKINHQNINNNDDADDDKIRSESLISKSNQNNTAELSTCSSNYSKNSANNKSNNTYASTSSCCSMSISSAINSNNNQNTSKSNFTMNQRFEQLLIEQQKEQLNLFKQLNEFIHILKQRNQSKSITTKKTKTAKQQIKQQQQSQTNEIESSKKTINKQRIVGSDEMNKEQQQKQQKNDLKDFNENPSNPIYLINSKTVEIDKASTNSQQQALNVKPSKIPKYKYPNSTKIANSEIDSVGKPLRFKYLSCSTKIPLLQASNQQASSSTTSTASSTNYNNYKTYTKKKAVVSQQQLTTVMKSPEVLKPIQQQPQLQQTSVVNSQTFDKPRVIVDSETKSNENSKLMINFVPVIKLKSIHNSKLVESPNDQSEKSLVKEDDGYSTMSAELAHTDASNIMAITNDTSKTSSSNSSRSSTNDEKNRDSGIRISQTSAGSSSLIDQSADSASTTSSSSTKSKKRLSTANTFDKTQTASKPNRQSTVAYTSKKRYCFPTLKSFSYYYNNRYYYNAHNKQVDDKDGNKKTQMSLKYLSDTDVSSLVNQLSAYDKDIQYNVFHLDTLYNNVDYILFNSYASDTELVYNFNRLNEKNQHFMNSNYHLYINEYFNQPYDDEDENGFEDDEEQLSSSDQYTDSNQDINDEEEALQVDDNQQIVDSSSGQYNLDESATDTNLQAKYETSKSTFQNVSLAEYELNENEVDEFQFEIDNNYDYFDYLNQSSSNEKNFIEYDVDGEQEIEDNDEDDDDDENHDDDDEEDEEWYKTYYKNQLNEDEDGLVYDEDIDLILMMKQQQQQQQKHQQGYQPNLSAYSSLHTLESTSYSSTCSICGSSIESKNLPDSMNHHPHHHQHHRHCHLQHQPNTNDSYEKLKLKHYVEYDQTSNLDELDSIDIEEFVRQLNMKCNTDKSIILSRKASKQLKEMSLRAVKELTEAKQRVQVMQYETPPTPVHNVNVGVLMRRHTINEIAATSTPTTANTSTKPLFQHEKLDELERKIQNYNNKNNNRLNSKQRSIKNISTSINAATVMQFCGIQSDTKQYVGSFCSNTNLFVNPIFYDQLKGEMSPINNNYTSDFSFAKESECLVQSNVFDAVNDSFLYARKAATLQKLPNAKSSNTKTAGSHMDLPLPQVQVNNKFNNDFYRLCSDTLYYGSDFFMNKSSRSIDDSNPIEPNENVNKSSGVVRQSSIKANTELASSLQQQEQPTNVGVSGGLTAHVNTLFDKWLINSNTVNSNY